MNNKSGLGEVIYFISLGLPVIVHFIEPDGDEPHYAVVTGYQQGKVMLNDPWNGKDFKIDKKKFQERWHDERKRFHNWIMVVDKEPFDIGKQYKPKKNRTKREVKKL